MTDGADRFHSKREAGIATRPDGTTGSAENDRQAAEAEKFACEFFNQPFNDEIYSNHGDGGADFWLRGNSVEVYWMGILTDGTPRQTGHGPILNPNEKHRYADLYVVVKGLIESEFEFLGWLRNQELLPFYHEDFYGKGPRHAFPTHELVADAQRRPVYIPNCRPIEELLVWAREETP